MKLIFLCLPFLCFGTARADHPNEGALTLRTIQSRALTHNRELQAATLETEASQRRQQMARGAFFPEISLEGGPLQTQFDQEKATGNALYAKADWNLYRGGRDLSELEIARVETDWKQRKVEQIKAKISRESARLYYELLFLLESLSLKQRALQENAEQMKMAQAKKNAGLTSEADVLEFELRESTLSSDVKLLEQQKSAKNRELELLMGEQNADNNLAVQGHLLRENLNLEKEQIWKQAKQSNFHIQESTAQLEIRQQQKKLAQGQFLPEVNFEATYGKLANEERVFEENNNYSFFLKFKLPLFSGLSSVRNFSASQSEVQQQEVEMLSRQAQIKAEVESTWTELQSINERLQLEEKNLARSETYYKLTMAEYKRGVKNSPDLVGASERLIEARLRNLEFRKDFQLTKLRLFELAGTGSPAL